MWKRGRASGSGAYSWSRASAAGIGALGGPADAGVASRTGRLRLASGDRHGRADGSASGPRARCSCVSTRHTFGTNERGACQERAIPVETGRRSRSFVPIPCLRVTPLRPVAGQEALRGLDDRANQRSCAPSGQLNSVARPASCRRRPSTPAPKKRPRRSASRSIECERIPLDRVDAESASMGNGASDHPADSRSSRSSTVDHLRVERVRVVARQHGSDLPTHRRDHARRVACDSSTTTRRPRCWPSTFLLRSA